MMMRPRGRASNVQQRQQSRPANPNFKPKYEWKHADEATLLLLLYLPAFVKERITMTLMEGNRSIKVEGQRPLADGRWMRFIEFYDIPTKADLAKITTSFERGIFTIVMPKIQPKKTQHVSDSRPPDEKDPLMEEKQQPEERESSEELDRRKKSGNDRSDEEKKKKIDEEDDESKKESVEDHDEEKTKKKKIDEKETDHGSDESKKESLDGSESDEMRILLLNMGTALLVITGLGAYIGFNLGSTGKL